MVCDHETGVDFPQNEKEANTNDCLRPTIGFLLGGLEERYQSQLWPGLAAAAAEFDLNLICFPGAPLNIPLENYGHMAERNIIYDLASPKNLDGIVILSGTLSGFVDREFFYRFCDRFKGLPIVSLFIPLEAAHNILLDNRTGMQQLVSHLIEIHSYRRIAFLRGPEGHQEADERFQAYVETLGAHGIPFDKDLVIVAEFTATSSRQSLEKFFKSRTLNFDALVAANDRMAVGAFEFFETRGVKIPADLAIVGFDDIEESRYTLPPLTTVRQPYRDITYQAIETIFRHLNGEKTPSTITLPAKLVIRQSCGCTLAQTLIQPGKLPEIIETNGLSSLMAQRAHIAKKIFETGTPIFSDQHISLDFQSVEYLLDGFVKTLLEKSTAPFLSVLEELLNQSLKKFKTVKGWQELVFIFCNQIQPHLINPKLRDLADEIWQQTRVMIGDFAERAQAYQRYQMILRTLEISEISQALLSTFEISQLMEILHENLLSLGIESCFVAIYDDNGKPGDQARLILAFENQKHFKLEPMGIIFSSDELIPKEISLDDRRKSWIITPLYFQTDHLGFMIMEIGPYDGMVYEAIRRYVSSALKGALILEERRLAENQLKRYRDVLEERVSERTLELHNINLQLQQEITERKLAEEKIRKLNEELEERVIRRTIQLENANQDLESFAYSVSHDLRAPLRAITGFTAILMEDFPEKLPPEAQDILFRISNSARQMNQLILDLLAFSRSGRQEITRYPVDCTSLAQQVFNDLITEQYPNCEIVIEIAKMPICLADPTLLKQVFVNLISNAIKFSCSRESAQIRVFSERKSGKNIYIVKDNGVGFDPTYGDNLFAVFQRLHNANEFEGTGVGLAIVKRIISRHGGQIWAEGAVDQGATFYFSLE